MYTSLNSGFVRGYVLHRHQLLGSPLQILSMWVVVLLFAATVVLCPQCARAQAGSLDPAFAASVMNGSTTGEVDDMVLQPDGKILLGGTFTQVNGLTHYNVVRLNADGNLDTGFNPSTSGATNNAVRAIALQPDGKILLGGYFTKVNGVAHTGLARLNADGSLDTSFSASATIPGGASFVLSLLVQPDGKILLGGSFTQVNGSSRSGIARLNADGTLDTSFTSSITNPGHSFHVDTLVLQTNNKILMGGYFALVNGVNHTGIARLNADGTLDTSFVGATTYPDGANYVYSLAIQADAKILVGGRFDHVNGAARNNVARLNADGTLDTGFNVVLPAGSDGQVASVALQADGQILLGGYFTVVNNVAHQEIARLNAADGSLDVTFNASATPPTLAAISNVAVQADGKILLAGGFNQVNGQLRDGIARVNSASASLQFSTTASTVPDNASSVTLLVQRTASSVGAVSINYATADSTAFAGVDYQPVSGTLSWTDGDTAAQTISVPIIDRNLAASSMNFVVNLSAPGGGAVLGSPSQTTVIILYTDQPVDNIQSVSLLSPPTNITISQNQPVNLYAEVEALANTLANVEIFAVDNASGVATDLGGFSSQRGQKTWQPPVAGDFTLQVVATDTQGQTRQASNPIHIAPAGDVGAAPQANLYGLLDGRTVALNDTVPVVAQALDSEGNPLQNVQFYLDGALLDSVPVTNAATRPTHAKLNGAKPNGGGQPSADSGAGGLYRANATLAALQQLLTVIGTNAQGVSVVSQAATLFAKTNAGTPPSAAIANVADGDTLPADTAGQVVSVAAQQGSQPIAQVELVVDNQSAGVATSAPYNFNLPALPAGPHAMTAIATALDQVSKVSTPVIVRAEQVSAPGHPAFFGGEVAVGGGAYFLQFAGGNPFGYYSYLPDANYLYHFDLGFEYVFDANDGKSGVYLYDFTSGTFFYTSPSFPFPYLFDFSLNTVLYYFPNPGDPQRYNTDGIRYFVRLDTGEIFSK